MPFIFKPFTCFEIKELIRDIRATSIQIACLQYDLNFALYLNHPINIIESLTAEIIEYKEYKLQLETELKKRA